MQFFATEIERSVPMKTSKHAAIQVSTNPNIKQQVIFSLLVIMGGLIALISSFGISSDSTARKQTTSDVQYFALNQIQPSTAVTTTQAASNFIKQHWQVVTIKPGDSLGKIFDNLGFSRETLQQIVAIHQVRQSLRELKPKQQLKILTNTEHQLEQLVYPLSMTRTLSISRNGENYVSKIIENPLTTKTRTASGTIQDSLFLDGEKAGLTDQQIMELANIFAWDIDFAKDLHPGDRFSVVFEEQYKNEEKVAGGHIIAAEFINQNRHFRAIRYATPDGDVNYYTPDGHSMKKAFLRTPVKFTHIASFFSMKRFHPVLHRFRAHKGVDYAAPMGTPVKATANGRIIFKGRQGGYGNVVMIQHMGTYSTVYGHLLRFASNMSRGARVRQGDVIGYVGMSGLATGPHLHYEFRINNQHYDPLKVKLAYAEPISSRYRGDFQGKVNKLLSMLEQEQQDDYRATLFAGETKKPSSTKEDA